ncbi:MAG: nitroreductase [Proteobacteria bacterium]|nr:nitroreductase [Pseudomonadota bacterium]
MRERQSVRAFLDKPVPLDTIDKILEAARFAPSGVNTQPWQVAIVGPLHREKISTAIIDAKNNGIEENPDYHYYPEEWVEPFKNRRKACGLALYSALNIKKDETEKRKVQWYRNYYFFYAPIALIFYLDARLCKGSWMDMGMFIQNVMLAARFYHLETCPQAALAEYPDIVRKHLNLPQSMHIVCGMAIGYADWTHPVNQYRTHREPVSSFTVQYD